MALPDTSPPPTALGLPRILGVSGSTPDGVTDGVPGFSEDEHETKFAFDERLLPRQDMARVFGLDPSFPVEVTGPPRSKLGA